MAKDFEDQMATRTRGSASNRGRERAYVHDPLPVHDVYGKDHELTPSFDEKSEKPNRSDRHQANQFEEDFHAKGYHNDVPEKSWLRGGGKAGEGHLDFDQVGNPGMAKGGGKLKASGQDIPSSPFSSAYRRGAGEGF